METTMSRTDRMQAAYERAIREGVQLFQRRDGSVYALSTRDGATLYEVTATSCTCPAGMHGTLCKHVASYVVRKAIREATGPASSPLPGAPTLRVIRGGKAA